jgi:FkbM family methyltransferase
VRHSKLPAWLAASIVDNYTFALQRWAPIQPATTNYGATLMCDPVDSLQRAVILYGAWEPGVTQQITSILEPGDTFVDIGANVGYHSLLAATVTNSVVAIEAHPGTFEKLRANMDMNPRLGANIRAVNTAVSDQSGTLDLYEAGPHNIGAVTTLPSRHGTKTETISAMPLGDILTPHEMATTRLIKMDVEGAEPAILDDVLDHLDDYPADMEVLMEANPEDDQERFDASWTRLCGAGFTAWEIYNAYSNRWFLTWQPTPLRRVTHRPRRRMDVLLSRSIK